MNIQQATAMITEAIKSQNPTMYREMIAEKNLTKMAQSIAQGMLDQISLEMDRWMQENPNPTPQEMDQAQRRTTEEAIAMWAQFPSMDETEEED